MTENALIMIFTVATGLSLLLAIFLALVQISTKLTDLIDEVNRVRWAIGNHRVLERLNGGVVNAKNKAD